MGNARTDGKGEMRSFFFPRHGAFWTRHETNKDLTNLENSLDALFVDFTCSFLCRFFFRTLLVLFYYPTWVGPQKPHPNSFLEPTIKFGVAITHFEAPLEATHILGIHPPLSCSK